MIFEELFYKYKSIIYTYILDKVNLFALYYAK